MSFGDASLPLQKAIVDALKADAAVAALVGARVYDVPPPAPEKPYISLGPFDALTEVAAEYEGSETTMQIDGWAAGQGSVEIKQLGRAIRAALHEKDFALEDNQRLVALVIDQLRYLREPDGITQHVAATARARTEPAI